MIILAISPHPDDVEYGIGGTLSLCRRQQHEIHILCNLKWDHSENYSQEYVDIRKEEARSASTFLGFNQHFFRIDECETKMAARIRQLRPDIVFLPHHRDFNPTHSETHAVFMNAIFAAQFAQNGTDGYMTPQVFSYETYSSKQYIPSYIIDVTEEFSKITKALRMHEAGIATLPSLEYKFQLQHKTRGVEGGCRYGEGISTIDHYWNPWCRHRKVGLHLLNALYNRM